MISHTASIVGHHVLWLPLEEFYRNGLVQAFSAAGLLTGMNADTAEGTGEGDSFPDYGQRLGKFPLTTEPDIAGDINMGRAGIAAGIGQLFTVNLRSPLSRLINQCPGRADFNTGAAVLASRTEERFTVRGLRPALPVMVNHSDGFNIPQLLTGIDATATANAQIVVLLEEGVLSINQ